MPIKCEMTSTAKDEALKAVGLSDRLVAIIRSEFIKLSDLELFKSKKTTK